MSMKNVIANRSHEHSPSPSSSQQCEGRRNCFKRKVLAIFSALFIPVNWNIDLISTAPASPPEPGGKVTLS